MVIDVANGVQFAGRLQPELLSTKPAAHSDLRKVRHLSALEHADVRLLFDMQPSFHCALSRQTIAWGTFLEQFPVPRQSSPSHFRHVLDGKSLPGIGAVQFPEALDALPNQLTPVQLGQSQPQAAQDRQLASIAGSSGDRETPISGTTPTRVEKLLQQIVQAAETGNVELVRNRCAVLGQELTVPNAKVSRAKGGGLAYRADFMLHSVLLADHVRLGGFDDGRLIFSLIRCHARCVTPLSRA